MLRDGVRASNFTYPFLLKACSALDSVRGGERLHTHVFKLKFRSDLFVKNSLIHMYCKCGCIDIAHNLWEEMLEMDAVSWNSMISGHVQWGEVEMARELFEEMPIRRNVVCWTAMINGYGREGNLVEMLDVYSKCGDVEKARRLFDGISHKSLASWNAIITGYVQCGLLEEAIHLFHCMHEKLVKPDQITMVNVLSACAGLGSLELGREVHLYLGRNNLELNVILATALVDMYSKCGQIDDACLVFVKTSWKDVALWNAMILGLAYHGNGRDSLAIFRQMESVEAQPNDITFIGILSARNHSGLLKEGRIQFFNMTSKHELSPKVEHYACMVDLLGRAGNLEEAYELVQNMVVSPDSIIWGALLSACWIHQNVKLADKVGEIITTSKVPNLVSCILLSNIYLSVGRWKDVMRVRRLVKEKGIQKPFGCSWIEVNGAVNRFVAEDTTHLKTQEICETYQVLVTHLKDMCQIRLCSKAHRWYVNFFSM
ncbi:hypothetical protein F0562_035432 [Nyssa sinensis]|uniref:DYW domain-containing protein n=1 Tax=Nyssa sinensis TaxID=561372 RepID=A0A5J5ABN0_9ASTE|nr:hypothetical protein F0562_035432 [Nyssa sinensis]